MGKLFVVFFLLVIVTGFTELQKPQEPTGEELVKSFNFYNSPDKVLVEFFTPWCGSCKAFADTWVAVCEALSGSEVSTLAINCEHQRDTCIFGFNIGTYPTIKLFQNGKESIYYHSRDVQSITDWAKSTIPSEMFIPGKNEQILRKNLSQKENSLLGFDAYDEEDSEVLVLEPRQLVKLIKKGVWLVKLHIGSGFDKDMVPVLLKVAKSLTSAGVHTAAVNVYQEPKIAESYFGSLSFPTLVLVIDGSVIAKYQGERDNQKIVNFVQSHLEKNVGNTEL